MPGADVKKFTLYVHGMHCPSCVVLTQSQLEDNPKVLSAVSNLKNRTVEITGNFGNQTIEEVAAEMSAPLHAFGYNLSTQPEKQKVKWQEFTVAVPAALGFMLIFLLLQKFGIINLVNASRVTYGTALVVGVVASLSTCMGVVGGLLLSMSATWAKNGNTVKPQLFFHAARVVAFFVLGGVVGALGASFHLNGSWSIALGILVAVVMIILGLNLLEVFDFARRLQITMPKGLSQKVLQSTKISSTLTPALVGAATFFLPCGFTQSMQIYALSTGNFWKGGLTMLLFALGTLPVLALVGFSSFSIKDSARSGVFFKTVGLVVILFALFNIFNSLAAAGLVEPIFNL